MTDKLRRLLSVRQIAKRARAIYNKKKTMQHNALTLNNFNNVNRWFGLLIVNHFKSLNLISSIWSNGFKCIVSKSVANSVASNKLSIDEVSNMVFFQRNGYSKNAKKNNNTTYTQIRGKSNYSMKKEKDFKKRKSVFWLLKAFDKWLKQIIWWKKIECLRNTQVSKNRNMFEKSKDLKKEFVYLKRRKSASLQ